MCKDHLKLKTVNSYHILYQFKLLLAQSRDWQRTEVVLLQTLQVQIYACLEAFHLEANEEAYCCLVDKIGQDGSHLVS